MIPRFSTINTAVQARKRIAKEITIARQLGVVEYRVAIYWIPKSNQRETVVVS